MSANPQLAPLYKTLQKAINDSNTNGILSAIEALRKAGVVDSKLAVAQVVALLEDNQYEKALEVLQSPSFSSFISSGGPLVFHYAYSLYRCKNHSSCLSVLGAIGESEKTQALKHLEAQCNYKAGDYKRSAEIYSTAFSDSEISRDFELQANILCSLVAAEHFEDAKKFIEKYQIEKQRKSYELAYNAACALIETGEFDRALQLLELSISLCSTQLTADGLSETEIANEKAILIVQKAYVYQLMKRPVDFASVLYHGVLAQRPVISDPAVLAVANNNTITLRAREEKLFDALKKSERALHGIDEEKLSSKQREIIHCNRALVLLQGKKHEKCRALIKEIQQEYKDREQVFIMEAALCAAEKKLPEAEKILGDFISKHPGIESIHAQLGLAHLAQVNKNLDGAVKLLEGLQDGLGSGVSGIVRMRPAIVGSIVSLYEGRADVAMASKRLDEAIQFWASKGNQTISIASYKAEPTKILLMLLESSAEFHLRHGQFKDAAEAYERVMKLGGSAPAAGGANLEGLAKLILATARVDPALAIQQASTLPAVEPSNASMSELEALYVAEYSKRRKAKTAASTSNLQAMDTTDDKPEAASASKKKKQGKKRKRYPKGFDPANPGQAPDPERWLPKWERSSYKKKFKKNANPLRGAQGSTAQATISQATSEGKEVKASTAKPAGGSAAAAAARKKKGGKKK